MELLQRPMVSSQSLSEPPKMPRTSILVALLGVQLLATGPVRAADSWPDPKEVQAIVDKAVAYLRTTQGEDGSYSPQRAGPGISAVVAAGMLRNGLSADDPTVAKIIAY